MNTMKYDVATNFDLNMLEHIDQVDKHHQIVSLFGKVKADIIGGGRASVGLPEVSMNQVSDFNKQCLVRNIRFNYLLNPLCLGNKDTIPAEHKLLVRYIGELYDAGIRWVTVCSPYLLELIKRQFPEMRVTIGLYALIDSFITAKQWIDLGADELTLTQNFTRNFEMLERMLASFKNFDVNIRLLANNGCLHACPYSV